MKQEKNLLQLMQMLFVPLEILELTTFNSWVISGKVILYR